MGGRLRAALGDSPEATLAIEFASSCLSTATYSSYGRLWAAFEDFCAQRRLCALPATAGTVACYVASLAASGRWQPGSLQPVLSAINRVHRDLLGVEDGPAQGALVTSVKRGWEARHAATPGVRSDVRRPLPASVASAALDAGLALLPSVIAGNPELLRSLVYLAFGFALMARAGTDIALLRGDVTPRASSIFVRLRAEKGKQRAVTHRTLELRGHAALATLVARWAALQQRAWALSARTMPLDVDFWRLPTDPASWPTASSVCSEWLLQACNHVGATPPPDSKWTSHCLRKGAASAAAAIRVELATIRDWGGWAANSNVVLDYIDRTVQPCAAARRFFRFLRDDIA